MSKHAAEAVSTTAIQALLSNLGQAKATGRLAWSRAKPQVLQGTLAVRTAITDCESGMLRMHFAVPRPDRIHIQYLINRVPVRRLDTNETHRGLPPDVTHKHTYAPATGGESVYRAVFEAFASECFIELPAGYWTEPRR